MYINNMKIDNEIAINGFILVGFVVMSILIVFLQIEFVERIYIVSPYIILWVSYIREKTKEKRTTKKDEIEKQKDVQYFFKNFIEWIKGGRERSSYLENFVLRKFNKYERYFGISILNIEELSPDEWEYYTNLRKEGDFILIYMIYVLEGKYILEYSIEQLGYETVVFISFKKPNIDNEDPIEWKKEEIKTRKNMINDIIDYVKKEHNLQLDYTEKSK